MHVREDRPLFADQIHKEVELNVSSFPFGFIDLFAGIGGFRIGLEAIGGTCLFSSEWDKFSQQTYSSWFGEKPFGDINEVLPKNIPNHDVLAAGFPCQPFSIAGVSKKRSLGVADGFQCEKQGNLFFKICEIAHAKQTPVLILENVKNLKSHDKKRTWKIIESELTELGYSVFHKVIDAAHWVPQHRERIFIVCFRKSIFGENPEFQFPIEPSAKPELADILEENPDKKYTLTDHLWNYLQEYKRKHEAKGNGFGFGLVEDFSGISRTLSARYYKDGSEILLSQGKRKNPRRLTIVEAARLMGYGDRVQERNDIPVSDTQAYRQFGNSVVPAVVSSVGAQALKLIHSAWLKQSKGCILKTKKRRTNKTATA
jgi:DNA (cytosine-5)-methyltransferase 1